MQATASSATAQLCEISEVDQPDRYGAAVQVRPADHVVVGHIAVNDLYGKPRGVPLHQLLCRAGGSQHTLGPSPVDHVRGQGLDDFEGVAQVPQHRPVRSRHVEAFQGRGDASGNLSQPRHHPRSQIAAVHDGVTGNIVEQLAVVVLAVQGDGLDVLPVDSHQGPR